MTEERKPSVRKATSYAIRGPEPKAVFDWFHDVLGLPGQFYEKPNEGWLGPHSCPLFVGPPVGDATGIECGVSFVADDLPAVRARLEAAGVPLLTEIREEPEFRWRSFRFRDPFGNVHEVGSRGVVPEAPVADPDLPEGDEANDMRKVLLLQGTVEEVWRMLTDPEHLARWYLKPLVLELRPGGRWDFGPSEEQWVIRGRVVRVEAPSLLVHTFRFAHRPDDPESLVTFRLTPTTAKVTEVAMTHSRFAERTDTWHDVEGGWDGKLSNLKTFAETGKPLEWE